MSHNVFKTLKDFTLKSGKTGQFYSLPALARTFPNMTRGVVGQRAKGLVAHDIVRQVDEDLVGGRTK